MSSSDHPAPQSSLEEQRRLLQRLMLRPGFRRWYCRQLGPAPRDPALLSPTTVAAFLRSGPRALDADAVTKLLNSAWALEVLHALVWDSGDADSYWSARVWKVLDRRRRRRRPRHRPDEAAALVGAGAELDAPGPGDGGEAELPAWLRLLNGLARKESPAAGGPWPVPSWDWLAPGGGEPCAWDGLYRRCREAGQFAHRYAVLWDAVSWYAAARPHLERCWPPDERQTKLRALGDLAHGQVGARSQRELVTHVFRCLSHGVGDALSWVRVLDRIEQPGGERKPVLVKVAVSDPSWDARTPLYRTMGEGSVGKMSARRRLMVIQDACRDSRAAMLSIIDRSNGHLFGNFRSAAWLSLSARSRLVGTLLVCRRQANGFTDGDLTFLNAVCELTAPAVARLRKLEDEQLRQELQQALAVGYRLGVGAPLTPGRAGPPPSVRQRSVDALAALLLRVIVTRLGGRAGAAWVDEPGHGTSYRLVSVHGEGADRLRSVDPASVADRLRARPFRMLSGPAAEATARDADASEEAQEAALSFRLGGGRTVLCHVVAPPRSHLSPVRGELVTRSVAELSAGYAVGREQDAELPPEDRQVLGWVG